VETDVLNLYRRNKAGDWVSQVFFNAACLRLKAIEAGVLDPSESFSALQFLRLAIRAAGPEVSTIAEWLETDRDLDAVRQLPSFAVIRADAQQALEGSRKG
jgi:hypothetical protein